MSSVLEILTCQPVGATAPDLLLPPPLLLLLAPSLDCGAPPLA